MLWCIISGRYLCHWLHVRYWYFVWYTNRITAMGTGHVIMPPLACWGCISKGMYLGTLEDTRVPNVCTRYYSRVQIGKAKAPKPPVQAWHYLIMSRQVQPRRTLEIARHGSQHWGRVERTLNSRYILCTGVPPGLSFVHEFPSYLDTTFPASPATTFKNFDLLLDIFAHTSTQLLTQ